MPAKAIDPCKFTVDFFVKTVHEDELEFVLTDAGQRNDRDYPKILWNMMNANLRHAHIEGGEITGLSYYGNLAFTLEVCHIQDLNLALRLCEDTVRTWLWKYRINGMAPAKMVTA